MSYPVVMMGAWVKQRWRKHLRTYQVRSCRASCRGGRVWSRTADSFLAAPHALAKSLPLTLSALQSGTISWQHALVMVDETATLDSAAPPPWSATSWIRTRRNRPLPPRSGTCPPTRPQRPGTASPLLHGDCRDRQKPGRSPSCARTSAATGSSAAWLQPPAGSGPIRRQWHASTPPMAPAPSTGCWWTRGTGLHWKSAAPATGSPRPCGPLDNEADHILAWGNGGTTGVSNLGQPCPKHHRLRHTSRWKPTPPTKNEPPGWTSPSGRHYRAEHQDWEPPHWPRPSRPVTSDSGPVTGNVPAAAGPILPRAPTLPQPPLRQFRPGAGRSGQTWP